MQLVNFWSETSEKPHSLYNFTQNSVDPFKRDLIPGQLSSPHDRVSEGSPAQGSPPCSGCLHGRTRSCVPPPHVTVQGCHSAHSSHSPSTVQIREIKN